MYRLDLVPDCERCAIHDALDERGFRGCAVYGCHDAGQHVTHAFSDASDGERDEAFRVLRVVHELLWLVTEARKLYPASACALMGSAAQPSISTLTNKDR